MEVFIERDIDRLEIIDNIKSKSWSEFKGFYEIFSWAVWKIVVRHKKNDTVFNKFFLYSWWIDGTCIDALLEMNELHGFGSNEENIRKIFWQVRRLISYNLIKKWKFRDHKLLAQTIRHFSQERHSVFCNNKNCITKQKIMHQQEIAFYKKITKNKKNNV